MNYDTHIGHVTYGSVPAISRLSQNGGLIGGSEWRICCNEKCEL